MRDGKKEYEVCKVACENTGCYCPPEHEFHQEVANTNAFVRTYFFQKGWEECQKEKEDNK